MTAAYRRPSLDAARMNALALAAFARLGRPNVKVVAHRSWGDLHRTRPGEQLVTHCGTVGGYYRHRQARERICDLCHEAAALRGLVPPRKGAGT